MSYASRFNHDEYDVPEFLLKDKSWVDVSWGNDMCPRWENAELMIAIWVDCKDPELREFDDHAQYSVVQLLPNGDGTNSVAPTDALLGTEDHKTLIKFIELFTLKQQLVITLRICNNLSTPLPDLADELTSALVYINIELGSY